MQMMSLHMVISVIIVDFINIICIIKIKRNIANIRYYFLENNRVKNKPGTIIIRLKAVSYDIYLFN